MALLFLESSKLYTTCYILYYSDCNDKLNVTTGYHVDHTMLIILLVIDNYFDEVAIHWQGPAKH